MKFQINVVPMQFNMSNTNLPPLPPLEEVLAGVRKHSKKTSSEEIDYKKEYFALKAQLDELREELQKINIKKHTFQELEKSSGIFEERTLQCPILRRETGDGEIRIIGAIGTHQVICDKIFGQDSEGYCNLMGCLGHCHYHSRSFKG